MGMWDQKIPSYIYGKQNIVRLILWTALFAFGVYQHLQAV